MLPVLIDADHDQRTPHTLARRPRSHVEFVVVLPPWCGRRSLYAGMGEGGTALLVRVPWYRPSPRARLYHDDVGRAVAAIMAGEPLANRTDTRLTEAYLVVAHGTGEGLASPHAHKANSAAATGGRRQSKVGHILFCPPPPDHGGVARLPGRVVRERQRRSRDVRRAACNPLAGVRPGLHDHAPQRGPAVSGGGVGRRIQSAG